MFTGIVQAVGTVLGSGRRLEISGKLPYEIPVGGSVAVNGCCLTHLGGEILAFDLSDETLARTNLGGLTPGARVNLEAAIRAGEPFGGHFLQGHVDGVGHLITKSEAEVGWMFTFVAPEGAEQFLVHKGSVAVDGVSLTAVQPLGREFSVALVPHTLQQTTLGEMPEGAAVNIEYDLLARYAVGQP